MNMQPQRVALASFRAPDGSEVLVYIRREWFVLLTELVAATGGTIDPSAGADFDLDPVTFPGTSSHRALQLDNGPTPASAADLSSILQRVQALESDATVPGLQAEIAKLKADIQALKEV